MCGVYRAGTMSGMFRWVLLLLVWAAIAGTIAWLHSRLRPLDAPLSPAERALEQWLPPTTFKDATPEEILAELERRAGVKIEVDWGDPWFPKDRTKRLTEQAGARKLNEWLEWFECATEDPLVMTKFRRNRRWADGDIVRLSVQPKRWRVYDIAPVVDRLCAGVPDVPPLFPEQPRNIRRAAAERLCEVWILDSYEWLPASAVHVVVIGDRVLNRCTPRWHHVANHHFLNLRGMTDSTPPTEVLAELDQLAPLPEYATLNVMLRQLLRGRVEYRVNWTSLRDIGITPATGVPARWLERRSPTVADMLRQVLRDIRYQREHGARDGRLDYGFDGSTLVIGASSDFRPIRRRYLLPVAPPTGRTWNAASRSDLCRTLLGDDRRWTDSGGGPYYFLGWELVVVGSEHDHSSIRQGLEKLRQEGWKIPD